MHVEGRYPNGSRVLIPDNMVVSARKEGSKLLIRVDDAKISEFWMQIELDVSDIEVLDLEDVKEKLEECESVLKEFNSFKEEALSNLDQLTNEFRIIHLVDDSNDDRKMNCLRCGNKVDILEELHKRVDMEYGYKNYVECLEISS